MTANELFAWMRDHRVPPPGCSRCGARQVAYYRDWQERPVGLCCIAQEVDASRVLDRLLGGDEHDRTHHRDEPTCRRCADRRQMRGSR